MTVVRYPTPEWLEENAKGYIANPEFQKKLSKFTTKIFFRIKAEPAWGIDPDIIFGTIVEEGKLIEMRFYSEAEAKELGEYILGATPQEWKKLLRGQTKFLTSFTIGKIALEQGSKVGVFGLAPHADTFIAALNQVELQFPDEMTPEELAQFREDMKAFREEKGV